MEIWYKNKINDDDDDDHHMYIIYVKVNKTVFIHCVHLVKE